MSKFIFSAQDVSISGQNNGKRGTEGKEGRGKGGKREVWVAMGAKKIVI